MVRTFIASFVLFTCLFGNAQDQPWGGKGTLRASATFSPTIMLNRAAEQVYLNGFLEGMVSEKLSFRGDVYWYMTAMGQGKEFYNRNAFVLFGGAYHFRRKNWDHSIGFMPGIGLSSLGSSVATKRYVNPLIGLQGGTTFYVWKYFHFFGNLLYVNSTLRGGSFALQRTDELFLSVGLGFQIPLLN
jgi:hypothetical protein